MPLHIEGDAAVQAVQRLANPLKLGVKMPDEITGRDSWIITEALATALVALEQLPAERQPLILNYQ